MTILVTGATGNIGRHVVDRLMQAGVRVRALKQARKLWSSFMPEAEIDAELMILGESVDKPKNVWKTFEQVIGRPGRNYAQWAAEHANDFR